MACLASYWLQVSYLYQVHAVLMQRRTLCRLRVLNDKHPACSASVSEVKHTQRQPQAAAVLMLCATLCSQSVLSIRIACAVVDRPAAHLSGSRSSDQQCLGLQHSLLHQPPRAGHHGCHAQGIPNPCHHPHRAGLLGPGTTPSGCWHEQQGVAKLIVLLQFGCLTCTMDQYIRMRLRSMFAGRTCYCTMKLVVAYSLQAAVYFLI